MEAEDGGDSGSEGNTSLEERLRAHSSHFSSMLELIPAKFYITKDEGEEEEGSKGSRYWVNKRKPRAPRQSVKEATKKAKRLKLDPGSHKSTAELQYEASKEKETESEEKVEKTDGGGTGDGFSVEHVRSTSLSNLQDRLKKKLEELRGKRKAAEKSEEGVDEEERAHKKQRRMERRQRKKELRQKKSAAKKGNGGGGRNIAQVGGAKEPLALPVKPSIKDETGRLVFSKFDFTTPIQDEIRSKDGGTEKQSKKDYKKLLAKAEAAQKKLEELKKEDEKRGEEFEKKLKWRKALDMARGTKVKDDPQLLKKTVKRKEREKQKSSKAWSERKELEREAMEKRQEKRRKNIQERKEQVKEKKIKKRLKKGGTRKPGF